MQLTVNQFPLNNYQRNLFLKNRKKSNHSLIKQKLFILFFIIFTISNRLNLKESFHQIFSLFGKVFQDSVLTAARKMTFFYNFSPLLPTQYLEQINGNYDGVLPSEVIDTNDHEKNFASERFKQQNKL